MLLTTEQRNAKNARDKISWAKRKAEGRLWIQKNPEWLREYNRKYRKTPDQKTKFKKYLQEYYQTQKYKDKRSQLHHKLKRIVLEYYSKGNLVCACCLDNRFPFLTLDHIKPISRTRNNRGSESGTAFFRKLIKLKFPEGYQVLCMNCNCLKRNKPKCPCQDLIPINERPVWKDKEITTLEDYLVNR